jgi:hypothetical protein
MPAPFPRTSFLFTLSILFILGCASISPTVILPTATLTPTSTSTPSPTSLPPSTLSQTPDPPDTGWHVLGPGFERRMIRIYDDQTQHIESLYIYRIDQNHFRFDIAYQETPQSLEDWQTETDALLLVNGGFFRIENEKYIPNGLTIVDGQALGSSYDSFGGMLAINDSWAELRSLAQEPYDPGESMQAGLQSFPLLVSPGGELGFPEQFEDNIAARRTVIAQDKQGHILFLVAPRGHFTLHQLSLYLTTSDLNLEIALNLDGGPSSGILVTNPRELIPSQTLLPVVILVYARP